MTTTYFGYKTIGDLFGVSAATVSKWRTRYADTDHPCPEPTIWIDDTPGWNAASAWKAWKLGLPGRGNGGGPLPLSRAREEYQAALDAVRAERPGNVRHHNLRALHKVADTYGVDHDTIAALAMKAGDADPELALDECDVIAVATVIRNTRKTTKAS